MRHTNPDGSDDIQQSRPRPSARSIALKATYAITAIPIALSTLFYIWAIGKQRYDGEPLRPLAPILLQVSAIPAVWMIGAVGAMMLAQHGRPWRPWATWSLVALGVVFVWIASPFRAPFLVWAG